ncbi:hypothetical protein RvY_18988 [Ramazzottius varieornatus]|uniref:Uncharacterized protein n=1 Tax=Ramazzottius varieornatus TaxID=947166 RepID=A0A1D1W7S5_RAMVA|nr:hypothetical protein RvY_18988 [Ramazzottius varieornatus]
MLRGGLPHIGKYRSPAVDQLKLFVLQVLAGVLLLFNIHNLVLASDYIVWTLVVAFLLVFAAFMLLCDLFRKWPEMLGFWMGIFILLITLPDRNGLLADILLRHPGHEIQQRRRVDIRQHCRLRHSDHFRRLGFGDSSPSSPSLGWTKTATCSCHGLSISSVSGSKPSVFFYLMFLDLSIAKNTVRAVLFIS